MGEQETIAALRTRCAGTPGGLAIEWMLPQTFNERFKLLERLVDQCYRRLVEARHLNREEKVGEDQLSVQVVQMLQVSGVLAEHDVQTGGHVDIHVRGPHDFLWIGEAKIYHGPANVEGGFLQLSTRYGVASIGRDRGEIVIYCWAQDAFKTLMKWQDHLPNLAGKVDLVEPLAAPNLFFRTEHQCPSTGLQFHVRHVIVPLFFDPQK